MYTLVRQVLKHCCLKKMTSFQILIYLQMKDRKQNRPSNNPDEQMPKELKAVL